MKIIIGNAVHDENGHSRDGKKGDQLQKNNPDYSGEVKLQNFYMNKKGWNILRFRKIQHANTAAKLMEVACCNKNIGYSQNDRYGIIREGIDTPNPCNCDCSTLVREVIQETTVKTIPDFTTEDEVQVLQKTGLFKPTIPYKAGTTLYDGDIIVTKTKGHTAIVTSGMSNTNPFAEPLDNVTSIANAKVTGCKKYICKGEGVQWVQYELCAHGYQSQIDDCGGIDGMCGKGTVDCIMAFQKEKGLEVDGICGKNTRSALRMK